MTHPPVSDQPAATNIPERHPAGLWVLFITEMWERFSYYGMRALLVLYLIQSTAPILRDGKENKNPGFGWSEHSADVLYGLYTGAVYLTPLVGGWLADRFLGTHRSLLIGGWIIAAGHVTLAMTELFGITPGQAVTLDTGPGALICFMSGLALIIIGTGFFKPCVSVMVGQLYEREDPRKDSGFTIFYMGINLGAFFSPLVAGTLGETVGWHWGFGSAAVGMIAGLVFYQIFRPRYLGSIGLAPVARTEETSSADGELRRDLGVRRPLEPKSQDRPRLTSVDWQRMVVILVLAFLGNVFFWMAFEQAGSSMNVFAKEKTDRTLGRWWVSDEAAANPDAVLTSEEGFPASWYQSVNPLAILVFGPVFAWLWVWLERRHLNPSTPMKFALGLYLLGLAFLAMVFGALEARGASLAGPHWLLIAFVVVTWGELCLSPVGLSMVTRLAPPQMQSLMMGVWFGSMAVSNLLAGLLAAYSSRMDTTQHLIELRKDVAYADIKLDARARELRALLLQGNHHSPLAIAAGSIAFNGTYQTGDGDDHEVNLILAARPGKDDEPGLASQFAASIKDLPSEVDDIEDVAGTLTAPLDGQQASGRLRHEHPTFMIRGLPGFYLLLVVLPIGAGLLLTVLTPWLKKMMHGVH